MHRPKTLFTNDTRAGIDRIEGVVVMMISWWVHQGGLKDLEQVAEQCNFGALDAKRDNKIGKIILSKRNYHEEMLRDFWADPFQRYMLETLNLKPDEKVPEDVQGWVWGHPLHIMRHKFEGFIGHALIDSGWWDRNAERIKKERENYKRVRQVMES
jgi:hypothetical protein